MVKMSIPPCHSTIPFQWNIPLIQYHHHIDGFTDFSAPHWWLHRLSAPHWWLYCTTWWLHRLSAPHWWLYSTTLVTSQTFCTTLVALQHHIGGFTDFLHHIGIHKQKPWPEDSFRSQECGLKTDQSNWKQGFI